MEHGWICLHRATLDWEWYGDINVCRLFIHCLLRANHTSKTWRGIEINRGQFWTSLDSLSRETGLSVKQIRTCFSKLERTGEVASKGQAKGRMVTIYNYDSYQDNGKLGGSEKASKGQGEGKQGATNNNDNNDNNVTKKTRKPSVTVSDDQFYSVENLNTRAWDKWMDFRKVKKLGRYKTLAPAKKLAAFSDQAQMDAVINSIGNEWSGLFPKESKPTQNQSVVQLAMQKTRDET